MVVVVAEAAVVPVSGDVFLLFDFEATLKPFRHVHELSVVVAAAAAVVVVVVAVVAAVAAAVVVVG